MTAAQFDRAVRMVDVMRNGNSQDDPIILLAPGGRVEFPTGSLSPLSPDQLGALLQGHGIMPSAIASPEDLFVNDYDLRIVRAAWESIMQAT